MWFEKKKYLILHEESAGLICRMVKLIVPCWCSRYIYYFKLKDVFFRFLQFVNLCIENKWLNINYILNIFFSSKLITYVYLSLYSRLRCTGNTIKVVDTLYIVFGKLAGVIFSYHLHCSDVLLHIFVGSENIVL